MRFFQIISKTKPSRFFKTFSRTKPKGLFETIFKNKVHGVPEILSNFLKNKTQGVQNFFQITSKIRPAMVSRDSFNLLEKQNNRFLIFFETTYFKNKTDGVPEIFPNYFQNKTHKGYARFIKLLEK